MTIVDTTPAIPPLMPDVLAIDTIAPVGDLDLFTFTLGTQERVVLQATQTGVLETVDHEEVTLSPRRLEPQAELLSKGREHRREPSLAICRVRAPECDRAIEIHPYRVAATKTRFIHDETARYRVERRR